MLSLGNCALLTAHMILLCTKKLYLIHDSHSPFSRNIYSPAGSVPLLSHFTYCSSSKSTLYFYITFSTIMSEPDLHKLLTFRVPNLISIFHSIGRLAKKSIQARGSLWHLVTKLFFMLRSSCSTPTPKLEDHPLLVVRDCLFNIFAVTLRIWRPSPPSATWERALPW
jgi:hypothetical protein